MRLTDVVSAMDLTVFPLVGLAIFLGVYALVTLRTVRSRGAEMSRHAAMALDDGELGAAATGAHEGRGVAMTAREVMP